MLYDPKWEIPVKADPLLLDALIAWLEKHPADEQYCFTDYGLCLAAQYNASIGRRYDRDHIRLDVYSTIALGGRHSNATFDEKLEAIACAVGDSSGWTFGEAVERAHKIAARC